MIFFYIVGLISTIEIFLVAKFFSHPTKQPKKIDHQNRRLIFFDCYLKKIGHHLKIFIHLINDDSISTIDPMFDFFGLLLRFF
jgi:hypothetical protein